MTGFEERADGVDHIRADIMLRFVATLIVTTLMVGLTAYVLSFAVLGPVRVGSSHGGGYAAQHARL